MELHDVQLGGIDLNALVSLDALLEERSVTRAAARVGLTTSAMSHALRRLRSLFDDPLLVRGKEGMMLTPRAEELAMPLRRGLLDLQRAVRGQVSFDPATARREFQLACTDYVEAVILPRLLGRVAAEAPGVALRVWPIQRTMASGLESGSLDVAMGPYLDTAPGLVQRTLFREDFVCVVRRGHPRVRAALDLDTYCALPHALFSPRGEGRGRADAALAALGRERRVVLRVPHLLTAMLLVARTDVVLTTPRRIVCDFADIWPVRVLEPPLDLSRFDVKMLWHERYQRDPAHAWLRRMIVAVSEESAATPARRQRPRLR